MNRNFSLLPASALLLLAACSAPSNPEHDKMMADMKATMTEDSSKMAMCESNKEAVKKVFTMFETGNTDGIENYVSENMKENTPPPGMDAQGLAGLKSIIAMHHGAFPDTKITVISMVAEGDLVMAHYNMKGTMTGAMGPTMPATNKPMDVNGVDVVRFENGKGVEHWGYWEEGKMMQQMGMAPPDNAMGKKDEKKK